MRDTEVTTQLKSAMGYRGADKCCKTCRYYAPADQSGSPNAKDQHCILNPAIDIPVDSAGWCTFHDANNN